MEKPNIINSFNVLQNIIIEENNILFSFCDVHNWEKNEVINYQLQSSDFYEIVEVNFNLDHADLLELYWKIRRYIGEELFIVENDVKINFYKGEISEYDEEWGLFDDLDDEILILNYKKYNIQKSLQDWKNDYESLQKRYYSLYKKKRIQVENFREKIKLELKEKIEKRLEQQIISNKYYKNNDVLSHEEVNKIIEIALDDNYNGLKNDLFTEFLFDEL
ncbi:hypothetical protein [Flavobacterium sp. ov086]|uniref:hypothetical protein n=1 Tax=Flavobacterium sp. ov086 TaxID=1761785 RepID=UPI000B6BCF58|nr:hypothetical protein [Flavobacterium sp. ov086]SNR36705.1 hypothetical protein SAMN04487979_10435 [Flavobacterium sp. ov086]